jgi:hypothetical protein
MPMPSDDFPSDALQKQLESEERSTDPVLSRLVNFFSCLPLGWPVSKGLSHIVGRINADRLEKIELMLKTLGEELKKHEDKLQARGKEEQPRIEEWITLVLDGLKRAERTRAKERVKRIGKILSSAIVRIVPPQTDEVEEMMRVATELSDHEVRMLNELVRIEDTLLDGTGRVPRTQALNIWTRGPWGERTDGNIDMVFSKLESFGLVTRLAPPNNLNILADYQNRYALLKKGSDFIRFCL